MTVEEWISATAGISFFLGWWASVGCIYAAGYRILPKI